MPGLSAYLRLPCAISSAWPNLESYPASVFAAQLNSLREENRRPMVVIAPCNENSPEKEEALEAFLERGYRELPAAQGVKIYLPETYGGKDERQ